MIRRVCCFGNALHGDEGVGPRIAEALRQRRDLEAIEVVDLGVDGLALAGWLADGVGTVLVDAWRGPGSAGDVQMLDSVQALLAETAETAETAISHSADLRFALQAAQAELGTLPPLRVVTVTVADIAPFQIGLSPTVEQAIPYAVAEIIRLLDQQESA